MIRSVYEHVMVLQAMQVSINTINYEFAAQQYGRHNFMGYRQKGRVRMNQRQKKKMWAGNLSTRPAKNRR